MGDGGTVISFDIDAGRQAGARDYLDRAGVGDRADLRLQDAAEGLATVDGTVDMAFLDGRKQDYDRHLDLALPLLRPGGLLAVDNVLLSGAVVTGRADGHWSLGHVERMLAFNRRLIENPGLDATVLPVGDGVAVAVRR